MILVGFSCDFIEVYTATDDIKKLSKKEKIDILEDNIRNYYQGKTIKYEILGVEKDVLINRSTTTHFAEKGQFEQYRGYKAKLLIGAMGEFGELVSSATYQNSKPENKQEQNETHKNTLQWHYFIKKILFEDELFNVVIDVRETKSNELKLYGVSLISTEKEKVGTSVLDTDFKTNLSLNSIYVDEDSVKPFEENEEDWDISENL